MQCVILAAGEGKRMRPLTSKRPKVMLPLANRPMIEHLLRAARDAGLRSFLFVVGYGEREIRGYFGDGSSYSVEIEYVTQRHQRGTADALSVVRGQVDEEFLLMNGDMVLESADIKALSEKKGPCMGIFPSTHPEDYGVVQIKEDRIVRLREKSPNPEGNLINAGIYHFTSEIFSYVDRVECSPRGELELTDALSFLIDEGILRGSMLSSWIDVGYPWELLSANERLMAGLVRDVRGTLEDGVVIHGPVQIGDGTLVRSGTYIEGPCSIGKDCRIGPHAHIRGSTTIGDGCHIGHCTGVKNSIVLPGTNLPHFNYLGDSVVGSGCNFGAGTKIANLRHDRATVRVMGKDTGRKKLGAIIGDDVQFGINCSVNVGAVIGSSVRIAPGAVVDGYIGKDAEVR
jgi:bifunctional UDP-N-acetylglucosamine pyrophosphorylase/glucosamine-1-phosphate N-acetyltransferase